MRRELLEKYDVPAPRYTSYPTVPHWNSQAPAMVQWLQQTQLALGVSPEISLYIHLPFCENLCTYCGCSKRITKNHKVERPYVESLLQEWQLYLDAFPFKPSIKEIHLGGGTPTFFEPEHLRKLFVGLLRGAKVAQDYQFSFEAHPNNTTYEHLHTLHQLGFNRISIGVQDFDDYILKTINRLQTTEDVIRVTEQARKLGYSSINYDLVYGLPFQTRKQIMHTIRKVKELQPDRIAFYSYAHVPWVSPSQRAYSEKDIPVGATKRSLYELGSRLLSQIGYSSIGMDHFALPSDELFTALKNNTLHRNFMGYTSRYTRLMIGLGASSISDSWTAFVQNEKNVEAYQAAVARGELPIIKGHLLSSEDQMIRQHILNLMCRYSTSWKKSSPILQSGIERLRPLAEDNMVEIGNNYIEVLDDGKPFIRNICMALDDYVANQHQRRENIFSQAI
ncbi:MAG: oxygen-independent coproporphyrinogen III oxidase [Saprospiraceae bacterium]|nr:oxygen-independent coproporphyrinogen III oxidase [Saprospiraceae bacterium]